MKNIKFLLIIISIWAYDEVGSDYPVCYQYLVDAVLAEKPENPRATLEKYSYKNEIVYMESVGGAIRNVVAVPDMYFDINCQFVCAYGEAHSPISR